MTTPLTPREQRLEIIVQTLNAALAGRLNVGGQITLTPGVTATVVPRRGAALGDYIGLSPLTSNAAAAVTSTWVEPGIDQFTLHHTNTAATDRTFRYVFLATS